MDTKNYTGYTEMQLTDTELCDFYSGNLFLQGSLNENEYLIIKDSEGKIVDKYCNQNGELRKLKFPIIDSKWGGKIKPRNPYQELAIDMLQDKNSKVKLIKGVYGSGKDYLMLNQALALIDKGDFQKIVFIRPNVTVANVPDIGYLKGDQMEKLGWTLGPLYDKVGGEEGVQRMIDAGSLEMMPLLFIRGRSFENSIVYVSEGQNITSEIAKLIISRIGEGSELWMNGDNHQTDKKVYDQDNGILKMIERLAGNKLFGYVYLPQTERGEVANLANLLDD